MIGPGGGRDLVSALVFGAGRVDGVEINPIIAQRRHARSVSRVFRRDLHHPRVRIAVDDGRSFVSRTSNRYDIIQASLVDTWAATAAGAYTLTENTLYTVEAFNDYLDHLKDDGVLTITRWVFDGLRLVSLAQEACAGRGWDAAVTPRDRAARSCGHVPAEKIAVHGRRDRRGCARCSDRLGFRVLYAPGRCRTARRRPPTVVDGARRRLRPADHSRPIASASTPSYAQDIRPTTDDRPFFFHTTKLADQFEVAFGRSMLFGNGLSALLTLMGISGTLVVLFVVVPLALAGGRRPPSVACVPRVLRRAGRRVHAHRGRHPAAVRAAPRASGVLADRHAVLTAAWHRDWRGLESAAGWPRAAFAQARSALATDRAARVSRGGRW